MDDYSKLFQISKNLGQEAKNSQKKLKIFPYMEHLRVVVHIAFRILNIRFVERMFKINNDLNNEIIQSFFVSSGVSLSRFDCKKEKKNIKYLQGLVKL